MSKRPLRYIKWRRESLGLDFRQVTATTALEGCRSISTLWHFLSIILLFYYLFILYPDRSQALKGFDYFSFFDMDV